MKHKTKPTRQKENHVPRSMAERNRRWYHTHKTELLRKYRNKYVAIHNGQVIGVDVSRSELLKRMFKRFGDIPFFFTQVTEHPRVVHIPSYALSKASSRQ